MSSLNRIISGTFSGLTRNFSNLIISILSLPIYLSFWSLDLYGTWILILTIVLLLKLPIFSYQEYLQYEFLKLGKKNKLEISKILYGSIIITFILFILFILFIFLLFKFTNFLYYSKINYSFIHDSEIAIIILVVSEIIPFIVGVIIRALYPFHYYPKIQWLGLIIVTTIPICQIIFVINGFELVGLSIITFLTVNFLNIIFLIYLLKLIKKEKITYIKFYFLKNLNHLKKSFYLMIGHLGSLLKNEGARLILAPFLGTIQMVSYVTMKTANNFMTQIFSSFSSSLLMEFADYINQKDKNKFLYSYSVLYFIFCLIVIPFAFFFQIVAPVIFEIWTRDKILFDPILFASMTSSFLIMIFYHPAYMVIKGKNLFKADLIVSVVSSFIFILLLVFLLDIYSIKGAGYSLIILEIVSCLFIFYFSNKWLEKNFVKFYSKIILFSLVDLIISNIFIFILIGDKIDDGYVIATFIIFKLFFGIYFLNLMPSKAKKKLIKFHKELFKTT